MAEIAVSIALEILKKTSNLIVEEGSRFSRLKEDLSWLEREMTYIQSYLKDVEHKQGHIERVANVIRDIRGLAFDVEDTMEKYLSIPRKRKGFKGFFNRIPHIFSDVYGPRNIVVEIESIKRRVEDLNRVRQTYGINRHDSEQAGGGTNREGWDARRSFSHVDELNTTAFQDHIENLVAQINNGDSELRVISITGMAGLGKTTLAKKVYNSVRRSFHLTAWAYVSEKPNTENILKDIARQLVGFNTETWDGFEARMYVHLSVNRYVIVFDDIWHTKTWDAIKIAIPAYSERGSRIILTSRHREVGIHVGGRSSLFELQPLSESNSRKLFETSVASIETKDDPPNLKEIGKKILYRCGGLPLAIVVVAGLLKVIERSVNAWNGVLEQMDQGQGDLSKTFLSSYIDLPTNLKSCFLYFGMFPNDHVIDTFDLINLWAAEGFIKGTHIREVEDVGDDYLNHLIARNLIQVVQKDSNGKVRSCRIHDILRSLCIQISKNIIFSTNLTNYNGENVRRVTTYGKSLKDHISSNCRAPKLRSLLCFSDENLDSSDMTLLVDFCKELKLLRVLYLQVSIIATRYSKEIWCLRNLTYLKLEVSETEKFPHIPESIITLENLLTLDVQYRGLEFRIPMVIWNMKRLRHIILPTYPLEVTYTRKWFKPNTIQFQNFQTLSLPCKFLLTDWVHKLSKLRTLKIKGSESDFVQLVSLLTSTIVLNKLETLEFRVRYYHMRLHMTTLNLCGYQHLSNLYLYGVDIEKWPQPDQLPPSLSEIILQLCDMKDDPLKVMEKIPKLRVLKLIDCSPLKMICIGEPGNFPQLEHLAIAMNYQFEITIEEGGMPSLKEFVTTIPIRHVRLKLPTRFDEIRLPWTTNRTYQ